MKMEHVRSTSTLQEGYTGLQSKSRLSSSLHETCRKVHPKRWSANHVSICRRVGASARCSHSESIRKSCCKATRFETSRRFQRRRALLSVLCRSLKTLQSAQRTLASSERFQYSMATIFNQSLTRILWHQITSPTCAD